VGRCPSACGGRESLVDESTPKSEELGPIGSWDGHTPDIADDGASAAIVDEFAAVTPPVTPEARDAEVAEIRAALAESETVRVNVVTTLRAELEASLSVDQVAAQRDAVARSLDALDAGLAGRGATLLSRLRSVPGRLGHRTRRAGAVQPRQRSTTTPARDCAVS